MPADLARATRDVSYAQDGVVSRAQLMSLGLTRWQIMAELKARRWRSHGRQTVCTHTGPLNLVAMRWHAVFEAGPRSAIDGVSALEHAGLTGFTADHLRVSVPRGTRVVKAAGVVIRQTRRLRPDDVVPSGLPRVRTDIAAIRAALWAVSDRQAATILAMVVQQRLTTPTALGLSLLSIKRHRRRRLVEAVILDLLDGAQAMGELDFARLCRRYEIPNPDRQVIRRTNHGRAYLDAYWSAYRLVAEIDGVQHVKVPAVVHDALRQNELSLADDTVLRVPLLGLRVAEASFMCQIREGLVAGGWRPGALQRHQDRGSGATIVMTQGEVSTE